MTLELDQLAARAAEVVAAVEAGQAVLLMRHGAVAATLRPMSTAVGNERLLGFAPGVVRRVSDDFTKPLPEDTWMSGAP